MRCAACGTENEAGRKFCGECGSPLSASCPACGSPNTPGVKFCGECGAPLTVDVSPRPAVVQPAAERKLVSVLFADLVGFTSLSEARDAEDTRELLSRYFDTCRRLIELYGGTVEKFIGDAVMAVWGTPTATEDDAERAVRAALDLVAAVSALGDEVGAPALRARAGVLTGEAAVTLGAEGQGMVAGDLVNTASRIQAEAEPGAVLVGESTRRATEQTVVYEDAGSHELKGKDGLVPLWRAMRVISGARGSLKSEGLEAPFVGRDRELRQIKELFHASAEGGRAHLVSVTGIAGIGKSRLGWEFYKYFDGIAQITYWHRGRCLSYGEGVTYWALADMVRMRARITEDDQPAAALEKLRGTVEEHVTDPEERRFVEPRLAQLLGLAEHGGREKQDLFAAWRLFFERLSAVYPVVMLFEDMQWADASLLDFVEYLLEWSRDHAIYVITLARPELLERRPTWGAGQRNFTSMFLEPLTAEAMEELLDGLAPGLPAAVRGKILARAEGVPLYAVETVRMLLDRGVLRPEGAVYRPVGEIGELDVPQTLHALIAARLDGLPPEERRLVQDASVLGKTFAGPALAAVSGLDEAALEPLLASLVRKELLGVQADPRSPEHGQYGFLQDLVRHVAYETLSKRERRTRHLDAAAHLEATPLDEDEIVEVLASHYVNAYEALPDAEDAQEIRQKAQSMLARAGERAASLAAAAEARRYFEQAAGLSDGPAEKARLLARAGEMAAYAADVEGARRLLEESIALSEAQGDTHRAARALWRLGQVEYGTDRRDEAFARMERAFEVISKDEPDEDLANLAVGLAFGYWFSGDLERAAERAEFTLDIAEAHGYAAPLAAALRAKAFLASSRGHPEEYFALVKHALEIALANDLSELAGVAYFILSDRCFRVDRYAEALDFLDESLALSRKIGSRPYEWGALAERTYPLAMLGRWDEALAVAEEFTQEMVDTGGVVLSLLSGPLEVYLERGETDRAGDLLSMFSRLEGSSDLQEQAAFLAATAAVRRGEGRLADAVEAGARTLETAPTLGAAHQDIKQGLVHAAEAALELGDSAKAEELLRFVEELPPGQRPPYLWAHVHRFRGRLEGDPARYETAAALFRELEIPFWRAVSLLELGEEPGLAEAHETFERLGATPWLERAGRLPASAEEVRA